MTPLILALDSGTSVVKALAFETDGTLIAAASRPNLYDILPGGGAEQDMERSFDDAVAVLLELTQQVAGREIAALAVTGQGDGTWLVDAEDQPVGPGWLWLDARGAPFVEELTASGAAQAAFAYTGSGLAACQQVPQLLWMQRHRPDLLARATTSLHPKDFLYLRLTGTRATSPDEGSFTFGDFRLREYRDEVLAALGVRPFRRLLPPMVDGTRVAHPLTGPAAARAGLPPGLPVVLGHVDVVCCALGAGIYGADGDTGLTIVGSTGMHLRLVPDLAHVAPSPAQTGYCMAFPVPGHTLQAQTNMASTLNIDWVASLMIEAAALAGAGLSRAAALDAINAGVAAARPGAILYHPYISTAGERGPFTDATARASILGLDQNVRLMDLARGVYEGLAFAARDCFAAIGGAPGSILITGGAARSRVLRDILAAVLDRPVRAAAQAEAGAAGAAMMAAVQAGIFPDMAACAAVWTTPRLGPAVAPDPELARFYDRLFPVYREAIHAMAPLWRHLHDVREGAHAD
jgi:erythritol kinase